MQFNNVPIVSLEEFIAYRDSVSQRGDLWPVETLAEVLKISEAKAEKIISQILEATPVVDKQPVLSIDLLHKLHMYSTYTVMGIQATLINIVECMAEMSRKKLGLENADAIRYADIFRIAENIKETDAYVDENRLRSSEAIVDKGRRTDGDVTMQHVGNKTLEHFDNFCETASIVLLEQQRPIHDAPQNLNSTFYTAAKLLLGSKWSADHIAAVAQSAMLPVMREVFDRPAFKPVRFPYYHHHIKEFLHRNGMSARAVRRIVL
jgi:hypothetical protein